MMRFPLDDWQFWIVSMLCVVAAYLVIRPFLPRRRKAGGRGCPSCSAGAAAGRKPRKATLTIEGQRA